MGIFVLIGLLLISFGTVEAQYTIQIGSGTAVNTTTGAAPLNIYYRSLHCQTVYTAAELTAAGANPGNILAMGYYVYSAPSYALPNFSVKMKHTTATLPTTYDAVGLTQVYFSTSYAPVVNSWDMLTFPTPFLWDGVSNILVDVCFDQVPAWTSTGQVYVFTETNGFRYVRSDGSSQCGVATSTNASTKPQIKFTFAPQYANDALIDYFVSDAVCEGLTDISVFVANNGNNDIDTVILNWSVDSVLQTPVNYTTTIPSFEGDTVSLGGYSFVSGNLYDVIAWTSMPSGPDDNPANDTLAMLQVPIGTSGSFTIGATGDFTSFADAIDYIDSAGLCGPVIFNVLADTFIENITAVHIGGASASNTITFQAANGDSTSVVIESDNTGNNATMFVDGGSHYIFDGLTFKATSSSWNRIIQIGNGASNNVFKNNILYGVTGATDEEFAGFYCGSGTDNDNNNTYHNNIIYNTRTGIYLKGVSTVNPETGTIITNNEIVNCERYGIRTRWHAGAFVSGNTIEMTGSNALDGIKLEYADSPIIESNEISSTSAGTGLKTGIFLSYATDAIQLMGNKIVLSNSSTTTYGMLWENCTSTPTNKGIAANNFISILNGIGAVYGMRLYPLTSYQRIIHNSIYVNGTSTTGTRGINPAGTSTFIEVYNNNVVSNMYPSFYEGSTVVASDYNNFFSTTSLYGYYPGGYVNFTSLADLVAAQASTTGFDSNSISVDPFYASTTNLHTTMPALNGTALAITDVTTDIDGELRNTTTPDIGADEFTPINNDAGITGIPGVSGSCAGITDVTAKVTNFGLLPLTSAIINWEVNGVLQTPFTLSTIIPAGTSADVVIGTYNLLNGVSYDFTVWTSMPNGTADLNPGNDSYTETGILTSLSGTYTVGATGTFLNFAEALAAITTYGICGPIVFEVESGTYNEQLSIGEIAGVDATNTVTFKSATGVNTDVVLQYDAASTSDNWVVNMDGGDYFSFEDMTIKSLDGTYGRVVRLVNGAHHNSFIGNILQAPSAASTSNYMAVVVNESGVGDSSNVFSYNDILNGSYGLYMYGGSTSSFEENNVISHNNILNFYYYGVYLYYQYAPILEYNTIESGQYSTHYPLYTYYVRGPFQFVGNKIHTWASGTNYGLRLYYCDGYPGTALVANNFVSTSVGTSTQYGMYVYYSSNINIYHNSINVTNGTATSAACYVYEASAAGYGNIRFANNSFVNTGGGYAMYIHDYAMSPGMVTYQDYNNYYATGSTPVLFGVWNVTTLADLNLIEPHSKMVDPGYASISDLHSYSALLVDAGKPLPSVPFDIDMDARDPLTPNIGADEYTLYPNDAGMSAFVGIDAVCPGPTNVSALINNYGLLQLTEVAVNWTVNGVAQTPVMVYDTIPVGGNLTIFLGSYTFLSGTIYDVYGWTSMPNGVIDPSNSNDSTMNLGLQTAAAGTFTIGATGDFATISDAQTFITNYGVCGPVVFNIQPGTYNEQVTLDEVSGVDATNTVTWQSSTGINTDVTVQYAATGTGDNWVWAFDGADYNTVQNITIKSTTTSTYGRVVIFQNSSNYNTVNGNIIESIITTSSNSAVIRSYSDSKDEFNTISGNTVIGGYYGIYWYGSSSNLEEGNKFLNNNIETYYYYGFYNYYQLSNTVSGNYVYQNPSGSVTNYPFYVAYCDGPIVVTNNQLYDDAGSTFYGLRIYYCDATTAAPGLVANNMVSTENNTSTQYGLYLYYSNNIKVYHNSVYMTTGGTVYGAYIYGSTSSGVYDFKNNSIVNMDGGYALYGTSSVLGGLTSDHNNLYTTGTYLCYFSGYYNTIADWQALYPGDVLNTDGGYLAPNNLHSNSLALDGGATPVPEVTTDFDGEVRDLVTPDVGCDEFVLANDDAGITALPGINALCPGVSDIVATVANYGLVDLNSVVINWEVNGVLQTPLAYTTTIPVGTSTDVVIGTYNMSSSVIYDFTVWTTLPNGNNDPNTSNDSLTVTGVTTSVFGTYTIGATGDFTTFADAVSFISTAGICGPIIFNVETGVYTEQVTIPDIMGTSATNTITFQAATGVNTDVVVQYAATGTADNWVLSLSGVDYCTINNIHIKTTGSSYTRVLQVIGASDYNTISNCILEGAVVTSTSSNYYVVYDYYSSGLNNYNTYIGNQILNGSYAMYNYGSGGAYGNKYINNYIDGYYYMGLYCYYQYESVVDGNTVLQNSNGYSTNYAIYVYYSDGAIQVTNNYVYDNSSTFYGIRIYYCDATSAAPGLVANNMISYDGSGTRYCLYVYNSMYQNIYNNSIRSEGSGTSYTGYIYISSTSYGPYNFYNNSIVNLGTSGYALYGTSTALPLIDFKNNNLFTNSATLCSYSTAYSDIAAWNSATGGNDISVDPGYLSATDLHTFSIDLNAAAMPVPEVTTDFDGDPRNPNFPDIGADEFDLLLPPNDLEVQIVYTLGQLPLGAGDNHEVSAIVKNVGADTQYNVPVTLTISGANTFTNVLTIDSIMSAETDTITFAPFTATTLGLDDVTVSVPADSIMTNNSASYLQEVTTNQITYADTSDIVTNLGYNTGQGLFLCKYHINGTKVINAVGAYIVGNTTLGNSLYGVVLDTLGNILSQSNPVIIDTINTIVLFPILDPSATTTANGEVLVGFAQTYGSAGYYPCGIQEEIPTRANAFYTAGIGGGALTEETSFGRFTIGAVVGEPAPYDAACIEITEPVGGCGLTNAETVSIKILNIGANNISGGLTAYYQINNNTPVSESVTASINSGNILQFDFATTADFSVVADSTFDLTAWVSLTGDLNQNNDTTLGTVQSLYQPPAPIAVNTTVLYGSMATIGATSNDSILWYDDPMAAAPVATGNTLTIGPLYDTAVYYAVSGGAGTSLAITEASLNSDFLEIQNLGSSSLDATGWVVAVSDSYTDVNLVNTIVWNLGVIQAGEVLYKDDVSGSPYYWGNNLFWNNSSPGWIIILDDQGEIVDMVTWSWTAAQLQNFNTVINGFTVTIGDAWLGDGIQQFSSDYIQRIIYDNDNLGDWINSTSNTMGLPNPNISIITSTSSCMSAFVPVYAYVVNIPPYDIGVVSANSPNSGTNLSSTEVVSVEIHNWGSTATSIFNVTYDITGTISSSVTEPMTVSIPSGATATFDFYTTVDFSAYGLYNVCVYTQLMGDGFPSNDTLCFTVVNSAPVFCSSGATSSAYEEIVQVDLSNMSNYSFPSGSMYTNYNNTVSPAVLTLGNSHPVAITSDYAPGYSTNYSCWVEVYIDWDNDGAFTEPQEIAFSSAITSSQTINGMLTVPPTATLGLHSMRVVLEQTTSAAGVLPCGTYSYGETEDYQVIIQPPYATDAGATAILSPSGALLENTVQPVRVIVYNFGTDTIFNMDVVYTVDGMNPILTPYVGALPAFTQDTVSLGTMVIPGGYFDLCAYTILLDDSSHMNDTTCMSLFADPQYDLAILSIDEPLGGCGQGLEDVVITFKNLGDTVFGNISLSYEELSIPTLVTETYTGTVLPGETVTYTFATPIDLTVTSADTFNITATVSYTGDPILTNNSMTIEVTSDVSPPAPTAYDITVWAGTSGTLYVTNPDPNLLYEWFDAGNNSLSTDTFYDTPVLFDTTTVYLQAATGSLAPGDLSTLFAGGNGQTGNMFDVTAYTDITIDSFYVNVSSTGIMEVWWRVGSYVGFTGSQAGWNLLGSANVVNSGTNVPDLLAVGGLVIPAGQTYGLYVTFVSGSVAYTNGNGTNQIYENNDMKIETGYGGSYFSLTFTPRVWNGTIHYTAGAPGCPSTLTPVNAFVQYANYDAALVNITSPVSASNLNNVAVSVDIYNNGLLPLVDSFLVKYTVLGFLPVFDYVTDTILPGQMISFEFEDSLNASVFGNYDICATTLLTNDGYTANDEFCTSFANWDGNGESCATAFPYLMINDPPVYQTTVHPYDRQWWRFEVPVDATNVDVSLCGSTFDTKLEVHSECPQTQFATASYLGYNDNSCGQQSNVHFNMLSAGVYWAKVYGYQANYGDYVLEITGDLGDIAIVNFTVGQILCNGAANGSIVTTVTPVIPPATLPITYLWSNGDTGLNLYNLAPGTYTLTLTDAAGIPQIESVTITEPPALALSLTGTDATTFGGNDGSIVTTISGGTTPYTFMWSNDSVTQSLATAYAGIYTLTVWDANGCTIEESVTINSPVPWGPVTPTANSHLIIVDKYSSITLDNVNAAYGSLIGVFYNQNGTMVCGGWAYWSGMATSVTAYGATPPMDNGYMPGENFTWRLYEAALNVEYGGPACYIPTYPNQGTYITGGFSGINCLNAQSIIFQPIQLPAGWSIWSTYVDPIAPNMTAIFDSIASDVTIVKSGSGAIYWPLYNLNTIGNLVMGQGYQIKMAVTKMLHVQGLLIDPLISPITIPGGWSIMGYLRTTPMNASIIMSPIVSQVVIVKSGGGQIYWPLYNLNTIGNMVPGQGYQVKMTTQQVLTFPGNTSAPTKINVIDVHPEKYYKVNNTGHNMSLGILEDAWNIAPKEGDEIGVFNAQGDLIGSAVYRKGFNAITIWGDDSHTKDVTEGIADGDVFTLKLWSYASDTEQELVVESWLQGNDQYGKDAISVIEKLRVVNVDFDGFTLFQNTPNPFRDATEISFYIPEANHVKLLVYNTLGELVEELVSAHFDAGKYTVTFETANLPSGTYFYKLISDNYTATKSMNIDR